MSKKAAEADQQQHEGAESSSPNSSVPSFSSSLDDDYFQDVHDEPPPSYSEPQAHDQTPPPADTSRRRGRPFVPSLLNYRAYKPPESIISKDRGTVTIALESIRSKPGALLSFMREQATLPPRPVIQITGSHRGWNGAEVDFDIFLDLMQYLLPKDGAPKLSYIKNVGGSGPGSTAENSLELQVKAFEVDTSRSKRIILHRIITDWEPNFIKTLINSLVSECDYEGTVRIKFLTTHTTIIVNHVSKITGILSSIADSLTETRTFQIEVVWPYPKSDKMGEEQELSSSTRKSDIGREQSWFDEWKHALGNAIVWRHKGWLGADAWVDSILEPSKVPKKMGPWGIDVE